MKASSILILLSLALFQKPVSAAVLAVLPGGSIQEKVDLAQPGDIVAIFGGTYPGDVTINKAIRLVEVDGQEVTITGNVTFTGITNAPPFEGFTVGSSGKGITVTNSTGLVIKNVDARPGFGLRINGSSDAAIVGGASSGIEQDGGRLATNQVSLTGSFNASVNSSKTIAVRTTIAGAVSWSSANAWFGYSSARRFVYSANQSRLVLVGAVIDSGGAAWDGILIQGSGISYSITNSTVRNIVHGDKSQNTFHGWHSEPYPGRAIVVSGAGTSGVIANNFVSMSSVGYLINSNWGEALHLAQNVSRTEVYNNIFSGAKWGISAPFVASSKHNFHTGYVAGTETGGVVPEGLLTGDPLFVSGQAPLLQPSSPCINAGVSDPIFNDLDGTRNDIGPGGGCLFDPQGWTTTKPVVISFDLAPQQLLKGVDTQVTLSRGQAVSQP